MIVTNKKHRGFRVYGFPYHPGIAANCVTRHPTIRRLAVRGAKGFDPVYVRVDYGAGLRWLPRRPGDDRQVPRGVDERDPDGGE